LKRAYAGGLAAAGLALTVGIAAALAQGGGGVILNAVEAEQVPGEPLFDVTAFVTVVDAEGQPLTGLSADDFALSEDGEAVASLEVGPARQGASIVLVLDTSGSMAAQGKMEAVQEAATGFVRSLAPEDRIAIVSFNQQIDILQEFSQDHTAAASIAQLVGEEPGAGTCLYDAAYKAVVLTTTAPLDRRAVILLTDGVDELPDAPEVACSTHTLDEVLALASGGTTRSPIYTIGVGSDVNEQELRRIAEVTGGTALVAPTADEIADLFEMVGQQLKSQYALRYQSTATSGEQHSLAVTVSIDGTPAVAQREFLLPEPVVLTVAGLADGDVLDEPVTVEVTVSGGIGVEQVVFVVDGVTIGELTAPPFSVSLNQADLNLQPGSHVLAVRTVLADGQALSQDVRFTIPVLPEEEPVVATPQPTPAPTVAQVVQENAVPLAAGGAALLVVAVVFAVLSARNRPVSKVVGGAASYVGAEDMTGELVIAEVLALLTVRRSQALLPGQPFDIGEPVVTLGHAATNLIVVPDPPVSRFHAEIRREDARFRVYDLDSEEGTFVNGARVGPEGQDLGDGDELALGPRTTFIFNLMSIVGDEPETPALGIRPDEIWAGDLDDDEAEG